MKNSWLDKHQMKIIWFTWGLVIACCIFIFFSHTVHAAGGDSSVVTSVLPYNPNESENALTETELNIIQGSLDAYNYNHNIFDEPCIIFKSVEGTWFTYSQYGDVPCYTIYFPNLDSHNFLSSTWANGANFENFVLRDSNYYLDINIAFGSATTQYVVRRQNIASINGWQARENGTWNDMNVRFFGTYNPIDVHCVDGSDVTYVPYYPAYCNCVINTVDTNYVTHSVLTNLTGPAQPITGHATGPINDPNNLIDDDNGNPIIFRPNKPTPTPFTPQPFNPPSIDTSTLETLVESLIDVVDYGFNYIGGVISGAFSTLLSNLGAWVDYIVESFSYGFNNVVRAIQNLATDFYNNMVSLFEPLLNGITEMLAGIKERIDYYFEEFDGEGALDYYETNSSLHTLSTMCVGFVTDVHTGISGVQAPQRLVWHIDFSSAPAPFNEVGTLDINFDWYENIRHTIVPWIMTFIYFGAIYCLIMQVPNIIHGTSGLFTPHLTETNTISVIDTSSTNEFNITRSQSAVSRSYSSIFGSFSRVTSNNSTVKRRKH